MTSLDTYVPALLPYFQGAQELAQTPVGQHVVGRVSNAAEDYDNVGSFFQGVGRGLYGVATGESLSDAWDAGVSTAGNSTADNAAAVEQWATNKGWHKDDVGALGFATEHLTNPLNYMGLGALGMGIRRGYGAVADAIQGASKCRSQGSGNQIIKKWLAPALAGQRCCSRIRKMRRVRSLGILARTLT